MLIADDHPIVREGLRAVFEQRAGYEICAAAETGVEAIMQAKRLQPHIAIVDVMMPELNGIEVARAMATASPRTKVLLFTMDDSDEIVSDALAAHVAGGVLKGDAGTHLEQAVEAVMRGEVYWSPGLATVVERLAPLPRGRATGALTPREHEVLRLVAEGKSTKEAASLLGISAKTADAHRTNIMRKLGAHSVTELVLFAVRNRIIRP